MILIMYVIDICYGVVYYMIFICNISDIRRIGKLFYYEFCGDIFVCGNIRLVFLFNCYISDNIM